MRTFTDDSGAQWNAEAREEKTPRHHGRWYLVFRSGAQELEMPEVRWQTQTSANRILQTASEFELRRRLKNVRARIASNDGASAFEGEGRGVARGRSNANAG
jgi:hypothetical protein